MMNNLKNLNEVILERVLSPTATMQELVGLIVKSSDLSKRILRLANSSYYSIPGGVSDLANALQYVSAQTLVLILLTSG